VGQILQNISQLLSIQAGGHFGDWHWQQLQWHTIQDKWDVLLAPLKLNWKLRCSESSRQFFHCYKTINFIAIYVL